MIAHRPPVERSPAEVELLRAVCASPDDDHPRRAYADWSEGRGRQRDCELADFIRRQCDGFIGPVFFQRSTRSGFTAWGPRRPKVRPGLSWTRAARRQASWSVSLESHAWNLTVERGFVAAATFAWASHALSASAARALAWCPLTRVRVESCEPLRAPWDERLVGWSPLWHTLPSEVWTLLSNGESAHPDYNGPHKHWWVYSTAREASEGLCRAWATWMRNRAAPCRVCDDSDVVFDSVIYPEN